MGLFGKKAEPEITTVKEIEEVKPVKESRPEGTVIAEGLTFVGDFVTDENMDIRGSVRGNIQSTVDVHISKTGYQKGDFSSRNLFSDGTVDADAVCKDTASFSSTASFTGTLLTANFDSARGSSFSGSLNINKAKGGLPEPEVSGAGSSLSEEADEDSSISESDIFGKL